VHGNKEQEPSVDDPAGKYGIKKETREKWTTDVRQRAL
jgi:hypothetical protein